MNTTESSFTRYRAGNGPIFSASKTPPGPGLEQSCELPFGFLWTPFNPLSDDNDWSVYQCNGTALPPVMCLTCCAYLNIYAELKVDENVWICPLCQGRNVTTPEMLRSPMTQVPGIEYRQTLAESDERDSLTILLVMDQNLPRLDAHAIGTAVQQVLGTSSTNHTTSLQLGVITFGKMLHIYQIGNASQGLVSADVFAKHEQITDAHLSRQNYLVSLDHDHEFDCLWRTLFAAYGVSAPDETQSDESVPVARLSRLEQLKQNKEERIRKELGETTQANRHQSPWTSSPATDKPTKKRGTRNVGEAMQAAIELATADPDKPARTARIFLFTNGCPNYGDGSVVDVDSFTAESASAFQIQNKIDVVNPAKLAQAIDYFSLVGKASSEAGVAVDVFCSGATEVALASYQALVEPSSGYVLPSLVFEADSLIKNLHYLFHETFVPGLHFNMPDTPGSSMLVADEQWIDGCILDIRVPSFFTVTHVVGPGELVEDSKRMLAGERSSFALGASLAAAKKVKISLPIADIVDATLIRIHVGRVDPISTFSVMLQMNEFFQHESHALFQCIARYINRQGNVLVTKTFTRRLATANDVVEFLDGVDEEVVPVLLGKEAVYRANFGRDATNNTLLETFDQATLEALAYDAQQDIDATIQKISVAYRLLGLQQGTARRGVDLTEEGGIRAAGSSLDFAFPPELSDALRRLYHLRRGPLVSPGPMQSLDDRVHLRSLFLRLPLEDSLCMMALSLWSSGALVSDAETTHVSSVPPDTLALWDNVILVADHFYELFVWSGKSAHASEYDAVRDHFKLFLAERTMHRFPVPTLHILMENDSMCRRFIALLAPSHADPIEHQLAHYPALADLSPQKLTSLQEKVNFHDTTVDSSFRNWFWSVSSATSQSTDIGISLCA